ncbi:Putative peptidase S26A, signal peptidase I, lexA/Signal peptidase-like superfamily [Colletotrichum destructivum]|uniref:Peptidase S26A, signal peptidase I, lexA/Signal peptidase-like superfamily n=1 Tax=Colletotrichum destructivum TaxID=34406 RepID=A0AAX4ITE7_9PEZI|nr:Putative peptidase S26A, signal peptidase I, lexA/Signal peptidase-like superfamily [Colletotrichum destructivum]
MAGNPFRLALNVGKTLALGHVFVEYGYHSAPASGPSMLPTFEVSGDYPLTDKRYRYGRNVKVGDLVHYKIPIFPESDGIKRVLGMPGDYVLIHSPDSERHQMIQIPQGHCWLVGDNLEASRDSRMFGPVPLALVRGKVVAKPLPIPGSWMNNGLRDFGEGRR